MVEIPEYVTPLALEMALHSQRTLFLSFFLSEVQLGRA